MTQKEEILEINSEGKLVSNESLYGSMGHEVSGFWEITNLSMLDEMSINPEDRIQPIIE